MTEGKASRIDHEEYKRSLRKDSSDLIKREDAIRAVEDKVFGSDNRVHLKEIIKDIPAVEPTKGWIPISDYRSLENTCLKLQKALYENAVEPKRGEWVEGDTIYFAGEEHQLPMTCSVCGRTALNEPWYFCPNCGARMVK